MNPIEQALSSGYDEEQVLNFVAQKYPEITKKISSAVKSGYTPRNILNFLKPFFSQFQSNPTSPSSTQQEAYGKKRRQDIEANKKLVRDVATTAGTLGTGYIAGRALQNAPKIAQSLRGALNSGGSIPKTAEQVAKAPVAEAMGSLTKGLPENAAASGMNIAEQPISESLIKQMKLDSRIKNMIDAGNSPEKILPVIQSLITPGQKTWLKSQTEKPFEEIFNEYISQGEPQQKAMKMVTLPDGQVGNLIGEKQGIGDIELADGKIRRQKMDNLIEGPEDAAVKALELIKSFTPEQERSSHHALSFYDPDSNEAYFMFHNGSAYKVDEVTPEEYERLSTEVEMAKTSGKGAYGAWATGEGSRGAAYHNIVKTMNKPYKKLHVGYNILKEWQRLIHEHEKKERKKARSIQ